VSLGNIQETLYVIPTYFPKYKESNMFPFSSANIENNINVFPREHFHDPR